MCRAWKMKNLGTSDRKNSSRYWQFLNSGLNLSFWLLNARFGTFWSSELSQSNDKGQRDQGNSTGDGGRWGDREIWARDPALPEVTHVISIIYDFLSSTMSRELCEAPFPPLTPATSTTSVRHTSLLPSSSWRN